MNYEDRLGPSPDACSYFRVELHQPFTGNPQLAPKEALHEKVNVALSSLSVGLVRARLAEQRASLVQLFDFQRAGHHTRLR